MKFLSQAVIAMLSAFALSLPSLAQTQVSPPDAGKSEFLILAIAPVKDGQGCTHATRSVTFKGTHEPKFPLSAEACASLLAEHGMHPRVDARNPLMQVAREAIVHKGTTFVYVFTPTFNGWTLVDMD